MVLICALGLGMVPVLFAPPLAEIAGEGADDPGLVTNAQARDLEQGNFKPEPILRTPKKHKDKTDKIKKEKHHDKHHDKKNKKKNAEPKDNTKKSGRSGRKSKS